MSSTFFDLQVLFSSLQTTDVKSRKQFLEGLENFELDKNKKLIIVRQGDNNNILEPFLIEDILSFLLIILRLSKECPFKEVFVCCSNILEKFKNHGISLHRTRSIKPSQFISENECVSIDNENPVIQQLFAKVFCMYGRVSHINQLQAYHVDYLKHYLEFEDLLMLKNGPLSIDWRFYIGIMGAARHKCDILIEMCENMFLMYHGDMQWLKGIENVPSKLQKLDVLNRLMAHQPWLLTSKHLKVMLAGENNVDKWSIPELFQAIVILLHFQTLSGFVYGCGVTPEIDLRIANSRDNTPQNSVDIEQEVRKKSLSQSSNSENDTTAMLLQKIKKVELEDRVRNDGISEKLRKFKEMEKNERDENGIADIDTKNSHLGSYIKYSDDYHFQYEEFAKREKTDIEVLRAQDYNWQEHCFSFINRLYPDIGLLLDEKFQCAFDLTYNTIGDDIKNVDTSKFRIATWNYIHLVFGIFHDDYQYEEVNKLLEISYKTYIKKIACFPERITFIDYFDFYTDMLPSEKVHINLLVLESRLMAALLYTSRCLMECIN